ncbi:LOW QUALITY PROTEIN: hypothetical protein FOYG_02824 [Fusarium oxysporum NRRL 32931]|uniref:Uncharacterized protein n=1 Tax=Fusarium oxysporum NRRL 32931 TaxID=660029 RepID=W9IY08_FUSOX|nr:LOW QUALITY PROTEIN: hypothetical protein FOYG_02824 [Fusarium oxysporum NRRL 32931]
MYNKAKIAMVLRANTGCPAVPQTSSPVVIRTLRRILFRSRAMLTLGGLGKSDTPMACFLGISAEQPQQWNMPKRLVIYPSLPFKNVE